MVPMPPIIALGQHRAFYRGANRRRKNRACANSDGVYISMQDGQWFARPYAALCWSCGWRLYR
jgi:hypothetical protein